MAIAVKALADVVRKFRRFMAYECFGECGGWRCEEGGECGASRAQFLAKTGEAFEAFFNGGVVGSVAEA